MSPALSAPPTVALLDRDGTINRKAAEGEYITRPSELALLAGAARAVARLNAAGVPVCVVTNQRGIARGRMTESDLTAVHARLAELLAADGAAIDAIFHCPHEAGTCRCRKPGPLLLEQARDHLGLDDLGGAVMIGDARSDIDAGLAVGARSILIAPTHTPDTGVIDDVGVRGAPGVEVAQSLLDAVDRVLGTGAGARV